MFKELRYIDSSGKWCYYALVDDDFAYKEYVISVYKRDYTIGELFREFVDGLMNYYKYSDKKTQNIILFLKWFYKIELPFNDTVSFHNIIHWSANKEFKQALEKYISLI